MDITALEKHVNDSLTYIDQALEDINANISFCDMLTEMINKNMDQIRDTEEQLVLCAESTGVFHLMSDQIQTQVVKVESICSDALQVILMNPDLSFKIKTTKRKTSIETDFYIGDKLIGDLDLMKSEAGGTKNIIAVGMRLIFAELCHPRVEGPIVLDEVGVNISVDAQINFGKFLKNFSRSTGRQIFLISHLAPVITEADTVISLVKVGTTSKLKEAV